MGRLTLNVLLSFAEFEREIISERTRDKLPPPAKGLWVGGMALVSAMKPQESQNHRQQGRGGDSVNHRCSSSRGKGPTLVMTVTGTSQAVVTTRRQQLQSGKTVGEYLLHLGSLAHLLRTGSSRYIGAEMMFKG